ncbi:RQC-minor-1 family DNA-binding protein [Proteinivorax hydrogeniformans]|uniref:RQC-minor-1 family DNA-binding protein n=1 Tax=Proteinivorax hydrogeniformans TaxID=1826727 RepID=A0AAU8HXA2_9FIRM
MKKLPKAEIKAIIRGADDLIFSGGRSLLAKVLKGSKEKKIYELKLDKSPVYGYFSGQKIDDVLAKVNWCIKNGYLDIEYDYRLPLLVYTPKGWEIEKDIYSDELLEQINEVCFTKEYEFAKQLKDRNRELILLLLDKIETSGRKQYVPFLMEWKKIDYKKVKKRINSVICTLNEEQ